MWVHEFSPENNLPEGFFCQFAQSIEYLMAGVHPNSFEEYFAGQ